MIIDPSSKIEDTIIVTLLSKTKPLDCRVVTKREWPASKVEILAPNGRDLRDWRESSGEEMVVLEIDIGTWETTGRLLGHHEADDISQVGKSLDKCQVVAQIALNE
ncbi:hypothetical protein M0R45_024561 [Rubus argutus]|uniref:Uncharacterized protein n=1 Tax=Rubus argutus TaxID=59490 RepID=A0AAW1WS35_RUBAR